MLLYVVVISLYSPDTHPTWLPIFTACQPLSAVATYSSMVPFATAVIWLYLVPLPVGMFTFPPDERIVTRMVVCRPPSIAEHIVIAGFRWVLHYGLSALC